MKSARNFPCPDSGDGEPCVESDCTKNRCRIAIERDAALARLHAKPDRQRPDRQREFIMELAGELILDLSRKQYSN
jgi:hypothetical protein